MRCQVREVKKTFCVKFEINSVRGVCQREAYFYFGGEGLFFAFPLGFFKKYL